MAEEPGPLTYIGIKEAARRLGVSPKTVYRLIDQGILPARNGRLRIDSADLAVVVEQCRIPKGGRENLARTGTRKKADHG